MHLDAAILLVVIRVKVWKPAQFPAKYTYFRYVWLILSLNVDISFAIKLLKGKGEDGAVQRSRQRGWKSHAADEKARERKRTTGTTQAEDC